MKGRPPTLKLHVKRGDRWLPVFDYRDDGRILTCEAQPDLALPNRVVGVSGRELGRVELKEFRQRFADQVFDLRHIQL